MRRQTLRLFTSCFVFLAFLFPTTLIAAPYYEGKTITMIVGHSAGGGYDRLSRVLAKHLPKHIPGNPTIIVENMAGASSIIASNHLYNIAKPDGLTIGNFDRALVYGQLLKAEGIKFDIMKFSWIGSAAVEATLLCLRSDLPYRTVSDLQKAKEIHLGCAGPAATDYQFPILLKEFLKINFNMVIYKGSRESRLAIERKEIDGKAGIYGSFRPDIERGVVRPFIRSRVSEPGIENVPVAEDLVTNKMGKTIMAVHAVQDQVSRPYVAPPGTPAETMKILRNAFAKVAEDPELKRDAEALMMTLKYVPVDECLKSYQYILSQPEDIAKELSKYIKF